jgi:hypothetical protein
MPEPIRHSIVGGHNCQVSEGMGWVEEVATSALVPYCTVIRRNGRLLGSRLRVH